MPSAVATPIYCTTFRYCGGAAIGPTLVVGSMGSPSRMLRAMPSSFSVKAYRLDPDLTITEFDVGFISFNAPCFPFATDLFGTRHRQ